MYEQKDLVMSYHKMRQIVGLIAILLPISLIIANWFVNTNGFLNNDWWVLTQKDCHTAYVYNDCLKESISHFYYTAAGELFVGALCAVAFFLFCYRGYPKPKPIPGKLIIVPSDSVMTNFAGLCALGVAIFPTGNGGNCIIDNIRIYISSDNTGIIHFSFAAALFFSLVIIARVNFRRTANPDLFGKMPSHGFYNWCGWIIIVCVSAIFIYQKFIEDHLPSAKTLNVTFWLETLALQAFGWSWLIKGKIAKTAIIQRIIKPNA